MTNLKRLLIVEDDDSIRENFSEIFSEDGYEVFEAPCGKLGIELAISTLPDLIICDITMPEIDGFDVKTTLSKNKKTALIPFIYLTARTDINDVQHGLQLGADDYITKPVRAAKLLELVSKRLKRIEEFKQSKHKNVKAVAISKDEKILIKTTGKHILAVIDDIVIIKAANDYSEVLLNNGEKALMKKSLKSWEEVLPEKRFLRIHRNAIINISLIEKIETIFKGSYVVKLKNYPELIYFSQRYSQKARKLLLLK